MKPVWTLVRTVDPTAPFLLLCPTLCGIGGALGRSLFDGPIESILHGAVATIVSFYPAAILRIVLFELEPRTPHARLLTVWSFGIIISTAALWWITRDAGEATVPHALCALLSFAIPAVTAEALISLLAQPSANSQ